MKIIKGNPIVAISMIGYLLFGILVPAGMFKTIEPHSGSFVAAIYKDKLLIGSVFEKNMLVCTTTIK